MTNGHGEPPSLTNETPHKIAPAIPGSIVVIGTVIAFFLNKDLKELSEK